VQQLIKDGVKKNKDEIQQNSIYLTPTEKKSLYDKNRKKGAGGLATLDFFIGFGIGSYIQGDLFFGITQSIMDVVGHSMFWGGIGELEEDMIATGLTILGVSRVMSWIFPFVHQGSYNRKLESALNGNAISYSIDPLILPKDGKTAVGLAFNLSY